MLPNLFRSTLSAVKVIKPSSRSLSLAVRYHKNGAPEDVYKLEVDQPLTAAPAAGEVKVKFLAAPINPADVNLAQGTYGKKAPLPAIGGNEGVAEVTAIGPGVKRIAVGDWILPSQAPFGTWRQSAIMTEAQCVRVPNDIPAAYAATMAVNMSTAYRLLKDNTKPGDWIIQNGSNSMVGLAVIQLAREMGVHTINLLRTPRPDVEIKMKLLSNLGGDVVLMDKQLPTWAVKEMLDELPPIKLALNCVGGESATNMVRVLGDKGKMITYGGMSKEPLQVPLEVLAAKQLTCEGFWMSQWYEHATIADREAMYQELGEYIKGKKLSFFYEMIDLDDFPWALKRASEPFKLRKVVLNCDFPDRMKEHDLLTMADYDHFVSAGQYF